MNVKSSVFENWIDTVLQSEHTLISGSSGSGKTCVVWFILKQAEKLASDEGSNIHFMLIDPTRIELKDFANSPCTSSYNNEEKTVLQTLDSVIDLIEARYKTSQTNQGAFRDYPIYVVIEHYEVLSDDYENKIKKRIEKISLIGGGVNVHLIISNQYPENLKDSIHNFQTRIVLNTASPRERRLLLGDPKIEFHPQIGKAKMFYDGEFDDIIIPIFT